MIGQLAQITINGYTGNDILPNGFDISIRGCREAEQENLCYILPVIIESNGEFVKIRRFGMYMFYRSPFSFELDKSSRKNKFAS